MNLYAENILEHFKHPHAKAAISKPTVEHGEINVSCGDSLTIQLRTENGIIKEVGWSGSGCAISQAGMSILAEELPGTKEELILSWTKEDILKLLGIPIGPRRAKCAFLALHALKNALHKLRGERPQEWFETVGSLDS